MEGESRQNIERVLQAEKTSAGIDLEVEREILGVGGKVG